MTDDRSTEAKLHAAVVLYNRGDYLGCQQLIDEVYLRATPGELPLVRAMGMLATAMHLHFHRGGGRGVVNLLQQFLATLDDHREDQLGVRVKELYDAVEAYLSELKERKKPGASFFDRWLVPRIRSAIGS